ncbi:MAG TPA: DNA repair protein RecO [Candidatus Saccharimonadales bacterium]|nr:DNA repair protein RecO [Candidatus Saccharimonadales bacterium]
MKQLTATGIMLTRTDFGEADRILTLLTPEYGKLRLLAKGVRRVKSKLAGGIELFSVSELVYIRGRGEIGTLVSARLRTHYANIVRDLDRTMLGYELIKFLHKHTEDEAEPAYVDLLKQTFEALDNLAVPLPLIQFWFNTQMLALGGHTPNLATDTAGARLQAGQTYNFNQDAVSFTPATSAHGRCTAAHIKLLRLAFAGTQPILLAQVQGIDTLIGTLAPLTAAMVQTHLLR